MDPLLVMHPRLFVRLSVLLSFCVSIYVYLHIYLRLPNSLSAYLSIFRYLSINPCIYVSAFYILICECVRACVCVHLRAQKERFCSRK